MRCLSPRTVGFKSDGRTISWSQKSFSKEYATFQLPCSKCLECRLEYARQWAVRCVHEASIHRTNCFVTLTYNNENLDSKKLQYRHFQLFAKKLRRKIFDDYIKGYGYENWKILDKNEKKSHFERFGIGIFVAGEYGDGDKRPHWHCLIFNWEPRDRRYHYTSDSGHPVYTSETLTGLWDRGFVEFGSLNFTSAGYVARYAAKKLVHGNDGEHEWEPISRKSSKHAIGKRFLEKNWRDVFNHGECVLLKEDGTSITTPIPRYYEKWLLKNHPEEWMTYVTTIKQKRMNQGQEREYNEQRRYWATEYRRHWNKKPLITKLQRRKLILESKFKKLQKHLKGDI